MTDCALPCFMFTCVPSGNVKLIPDIGSAASAKPSAPSAITGRNIEPVVSEDGSSRSYLALFWDSRICLFASPTLSPRACIHLVMPRWYTWISLRKEVRRTFESWLSRTRYFFHAHSYRSSAVILLKILIWRQRYNDKRTCTRLHRGYAYIANYPVSGLTLYFDVSKRGFTFRNSLYNGVGYMGWNRHDNPFLVRPKRDGVFNISQLEYTCSTGKYYVGAAIHSRHFANPIEAEALPENSRPTRHTSCAWWGYAEQKLWGAGGKDVWGMLQYSENTSRKNACYRYAELGATYADSLNTCGVSAQFAQFSQGKEYSLELTYKRQLNASIALQPSFQYIKNKNGNYTVVCARLYYDF